jgi:hypothetical protein
MPKRLLATTIILTTILALVVGIQTVEVVEANYSTDYPESPDTNKPSIIIKTTENDKISNVNYVNLS